MFADRFVEVQINRASHIAAKVMRDKRIVWVNFFVFCELEIKAS